MGFRDTERALGSTSGAVIVRYTTFFDASVEEERCAQRTVEIEGQRTGFFLVREGSSGEA